MDSPVHIPLVELRVALESDDGATALSTVLGTSAPAHSEGAVVAAHGKANSLHPEARPATVLSAIVNHHNAPVH